MSLTADTAAADQQPPLHEGVFGIHQVHEIRPSPDNRKRFNEIALQELAASVKADGVAQPILIRPVTTTHENPEPYEIIAGERRWRASVIAGLATIPAMVRPMSDLQAAKIRILENLQREDPHPLEEAEGYEQLMMRHGYNADQLADEIKKSRSYVYGRLKLCALSTDVREQFLSKRIPASTALLIARIAVPALQVQALEEILRADHAGIDNPMSYRQAVAHIQQRYMLDLTVAPFQLSDAKLLASAGACTKCPKRTGNQPEVFPEVSPDVCTDPNCYTEKRAAVVAQQIIKANKRGIPVFKDKAAADEFTGEDMELVVSSDYVGFHGTHLVDSRHYYSRIEEVLKDDALPPAMAYLKAKDKLVPMFDEGALQVALEKAGICESSQAREARQAAAEAGEGPKELSPQAGASAKKKETLETAAKNEQTFRLALYRKLRAQAATGLAAESLRELTRLATNEFPLPHELADLYPFNHRDDDEVTSYIDNATLPELQLLLVDLLVAETLSVGTWDMEHIKAGDHGHFESVLKMAKNEGIDHDQVREELFPSPIDTESMQYDDLVAFISRAPHRINELGKAVLADHARFDLVNLLEKAALSLGYKYSVDGFVRIEYQTESSTELLAEVDSSESAPVAAVVEADPVAPPPKAKANKKAAASKAAAAVKGPLDSIKPIKKIALSPAAAWPFPKSST